MGNRSAVSPTRHIAPSAAAHQWDKIVQEMEQIRYHERNKVLSGLLATTPTSASTQASGATGATAWNVNLGAGIVIVGGVAKEFAAQADYAVHSATIVTGLQSTYTVVAALVAKNVSGTVTLAVVLGTAALTAGGTAVAPTDAVIQAAVGAANSWVKVAELTINRTADTTVTQSQDSTKRPLLGVSQDAGFGDWSALA